MFYAHFNCINKSLKWNNMFFLGEFWPLYNTSTNGMSVVFFTVFTTIQNNLFIHLIIITFFHEYIYSMADTRIFDSNSRSEIYEEQSAWVSKDGVLSMLTSVSCMVQFTQKTVRPNKNSGFSGFFSIPFWCVNSY